MKSYLKYKPNFKIKTISVLRPCRNEHLLAHTRTSRGPEKQSEPAAIPFRPTCLYEGEAAQRIHPVPHAEEKSLCPAVHLQE